MNTLLLLKFGIILNIITSFAIGVSANEAYLNGLMCGQPISTISNLTPVPMNSAMTMTLYKQPGDSMHIGQVESLYVNYLSWQDQLYGRIMALCGVDQINEVVRFLQQIYGEPMLDQRVKTTTWLTEDYVIEVRRFSYHLAQVEILCREMFFTLNELEIQAENATQE